MLLLQCVAAVAALSGAIAAPFDLLQNRDFTSIEARQSSVGEEGVWDGMYYWFWTDGAGQVNFNRTGPSNYKVNWKDSGNFLGGVGRKPGTNKAISYTADFEVNGNGYLAAFGWTTNPAVEYYVLDSYGTYTPSEAAGLNIRYRGEITSDGGVYKIYSGIRFAQGLGDLTWLLYWSVRTERRTSGTITLKNHFDAWKELGMQMGDFDRQVMAVEGYMSSGEAAVTVKLD